MTDSFDAMMQKYGQWDFTFWCPKDRCYLHSRSYHDGAWMEGHWCDPVIYWGA